MKTQCRFFPLRESRVPVAPLAGPNGYSEEEITMNLYGKKKKNWVSVTLSVTHLRAVLGFSDTSGRILLTNQDRAQMLTDSLKLRRLHAEMLSPVPRQELGGASLAAPPRAAACRTAHRKTHAEHYFCFSPFLGKAKLLFVFLSVRETGTNLCRSFVNKVA